MIRLKVIPAHNFALRLIHINPKVITSIWKGDLSILEYNYNRIEYYNYSSFECKIILPTIVKISLNQTHVVLHSGKRWRWSTAV